jgi:hypothetical protein
MNGAFFVFTDNAPNIRSCGLGSSTYLKCRELSWMPFFFVLFPAEVYAEEFWPNGAWTYDTVFQISDEIT